MKKLFIKFFGVLSLLFIANIAHADVTEVFSQMSCGKLKNNLVSVANSKDTASLSINYTEALKCNNSIFYKNLIVKMFYLMFGDFTLKSMDIVLTFTGYILDENFDFYDKAKAEVEPLEPFKGLITIMEGLAFICCMFLLAFFSIFYIYYLMNSAHDGSALGKSNNVFWTTSRLFAAIFLCLPLDSFGNFTAIQVLVMMFATLGVLLANVVWFILPVFELLFSDDVLEIAEKNESINKSQVSTLVESGIQMQICDIQARKGIYLYGLDVEEMTKENIELSEFGSCIKNNENNGVSSISNVGSLSYIPSSLNATKLCARKTNKDIIVNCGSIAVKNIEEIKNLFSVGNLEIFAKETRKIAYDIIGRYCIDNKYSKKEKNEIEYEKECAMILDSNSINYVPKYGKQVIATYQNAPQSDAIVQNINLLKDSLYNEIKGKASNIVKFETDIKKIEEKIATSLVKGWLSAASFILELGSEYKTRELKFNAAFAAFSASAKFQISSDSVSRGGNKDSQLSREILNSVKDISTLVSQYAGESNYVIDKKESENLLVEILFPVIPYVKEFNNMRDGVTTKTEKDSCSVDFNNCARTSINPLVGLMKIGNGLLDYSIAGVVVTEVISKFAASFAASTGSNILMFLANVNELLGMLFFFNLISGLLIVYLPGIIIFAYFTGNALGWFLLVFKKLVIAQLWLLMHMSPSNNEGFAGKGAGGYKLLLDILLRPSFIVFGVFVAFIMLSIMVSILNVLFGMVLSTFVFFNSPSGIIEFVTNFILTLVYVVLLVIVMLRAGKAMYKVPNALTEWFEMDNPEDSSMWSELTSKAQNFMLTDMKKVIYFTKM